MSPTKRTPKKATTKKASKKGKGPRSPAEPLDAAADTDDLAAMRDNWPASVDVGEWKGLPNYCCKLCAFATVSRASAIEHHADHFPPSLVKPPHIVNTGLVSETGAEIVRVVDTPAREESKP